MFHDIPQITTLPIRFQSLVGRGHWWYDASLPHTSRQTICRRNNAVPLSHRDRKQSNTICRRYNALLLSLSHLRARYRLGGGHWSGKSSELLGEDSRQKPSDRTLVVFSCNTAHNFWAKISKSGKRWKSFFAITSSKLFKNWFCKGHIFSNNIFHNHCFLYVL